jgi:GT2 family glycosyltransferase
VTSRALDALERAGARRVILVDDEGRGGGEVLKRGRPGLEVIATDRPLFWTGCAALGLAEARRRGETHALLMNQDAEAAPDLLERLGETVARHPEALVGSAVLYAREPERVWSAGGKMEWFGRGFRVVFHGAPVEKLPERPYAVDWLFGMGTVVPLALLPRIGLPDGETFPMAFGDHDYSLRARERGVELLVDPRARLLHSVGSYDARAAGPPSATLYVSWMRDPRHNLSLKTHAAFWRRHGPRGLWPLSLALRVAVILANYVRIRLLFPGEGRSA